ncbi:MULTISPECIES: hypothetical protein [Streptomyces]|uniref:Uncharacterized protein n=3 Tax=Streptomyces TaxID=1883 RepID=A0A1I6NV14_9ACTN|nr:MULTISPECIES: hypothetical protein [Streptomyces]MCK1817090.1 hypothetical protein [Streptomyces sp. XM4011]QKV70280.1 hypothetical protein HUT13_17005 [Streptomyces harbinensis]UWM50698.1 hypothetical protein N0X72_17785 [Streptomyces carpaticus]SFS31698.1 hypothetical protein SAMN05444716_10161 [Streptomyces harbinensis]
MARSPQDEAAWRDLDPATRARLDFLDPEDFTVGRTAEAAEQWQRFTTILDKAENYRSAR